MIIIDLIFNLALLVSVSVLSGFIDSRWRRSTTAGVVAQGLLFGLVALLGMLNPYHPAPGIIFDGRSVVLSLCALFFGPVSGFIAAAIALAYRISIGGGGAIMGVSVILSSTFVGSICHYYFKKGTFQVKTLNLYLMGFIVHLIMVALIFTIPAPARNLAFKTLPFTILGIYPIATALIGKILKDQSDSIDRRKAEVALQESEARFRSLFENSLMGISETEPDGKLIHANRQFAKLYGYNSPEEMIAEVRSVTQFYANPIDRVEIVRILRDQEAVEPRETGIIRRDGTRGLFLIGVSSVREPNGKLIRYQATHVDITARREAELEILKAKEQAESGDRLKTAFMNNISHEIRTPLNSILGFSQLMADPGITHAEKLQYLAIVEASSDRLMNTVTDYMDISLLASGNQKVEKKPFFSGELLDGVYNKFIRRCETKKLSLTVVSPPDNNNLQLNSDHELLIKVLCHLVDNAVKFTSQGGIVFGYRVIPSNLSGSREEVEFFVTDTGIGISMTGLTSIFDPFSQEISSGTHGHDGSGLGLSIAKGMAGLLGGRIWLESAMGKGSSFFFTVPAEAAVAEQAGQPVTLLTTPGKSIVLIAEDEPTGCLLLEKILQKNGIATIVADNGQKAVDSCRQNPLISLVLMDLRMPVMDGLKATKEIKSFLPRLPVIAVTAFALSGDEKAAIAAGCDDYIAKPVIRQVLLNKLKKFGVAV